MVLGIQQHATPHRTMDSVFPVVSVIMFQAIASLHVQVDISSS